MKKGKHSPKSQAIRDRYVFLMLIVLSITVRIPFLKAFDLVTYDGTYYINQATSILGGAYRSSVFPIGYPIFIALLIPLLRDGVRAAQVVSSLACLCSLIVFYRLCSRFVKRSYALIASIILVITPLFIRLSMMTMSESIYIFWVLLGFLLFEGNKELYSGLCMGMASITRPEALGILGILSILRLRRPRRLLLMLAGFVIAFSINVAVQSGSAGRLVLVPKTQLFGTGAEYWKLREAWIEFPGREQALEEVGEEGAKQNVFVDYLERMPRELLLFIRHVSPVVFLLALYGIYRRRLFLLALFVPFFFFPLFTLRSEPRFVLPYIPGFVLYAFIGLSYIRRRKILTSLYVLLFLSAAAGIIVNRDQIVLPVSAGYQWAKSVGLSFRNRVGSEDKIADRKPFFAFYSGGEYVEIPVATYDETIGYLAERDIKYLVLHRGTIHMMRRKLRPLLYDRAVINGELRFSQIFFGHGVSIFQRERKSDPVKRRPLIPECDKLLYGPSWSPNGERIAYRMIEQSGRGGIYTISPDGGRARLIFTEAATEDPISWASDSRRFAFAKMDEGNMDIFVYHITGELEQITSHVGMDRSPSWSRDGKEIFFCSDRSGQSEIWSKNLDTGEISQITTDGGYGYPSVSPDGRSIAWIREGEGLYIFDRTTRAVRRAETPQRVFFAPAWSPDGRFIAVTGSDWGKTDIYILTADGKNAVLLTKTVRKEGHPAWSPDGRAIATVTFQNNAMGLWVLTGIEPYTERLMNPARVRVFQYIN